MKPLNPQPGIGLSPALSILLLLATFFSASPAYAASSYVGTWAGIYPGSTSADNASCQLCHAASTQNLNPYGEAICSSTAGNISNRIQAVEGVDSDTDPTGSDNLTEISANTQPGWTPGTVNPIYSRGNCNPIGTVEAPPAFIPGDMDPVAGNQPPVADANGPYSGTVDIPLTFDGSASNDPDGSIVSYSWDFGDGANGSGVNPTHTYLTAGTFTVTLTVTDDGGATGTATSTATIGMGNQPPVADANGPYSGTVGNPVTFDGTASNDPDGTIVSYTWDFGDSSNGSGASPSHTYMVAGTYNVTLTVTDDGGASDSSGTTATITSVPVNQPPLADANGPYSGTAGVAIMFDGTGSSDSDGTIVAYDWDFGDGNTGSGATPTYAYAADGNYTVTLTVTDDGGATGTATSTANIGVVNQPPVADPNGPYSGTTSAPVAFDGTGSSDTDGTIVSYAWDFGDGNNGSGVTPTHTYAMDGSYTVMLTVTDDAGDTDTAMTTAVIGQGNLPPQSNPGGPYTGKVKIPVQFDGSASNDADGKIVSYIWDFGDGSHARGQNPSHTYSSAGTYHVTLEVTDDGGATDSAMTTATIVAAGDKDDDDEHGDKDDDDKHGDKDDDKDDDDHHDKDDDKEKHKHKDKRKHKDEREENRHGHDD